jgi:hypothetical protein
MHATASTVHKLQHVRCRGHAVCCPAGTLIHGDDGSQQHAGYNYHLCTSAAAAAAAHGYAGKTVTLVEAVLQYRWVAKAGCSQAQQYI